jgi:hypothetical protein
VKHCLVGGLTILEIKDYSRVFATKHDPSLGLDGVAIWFAMAGGGYEGFDVATLLRLPYLEVLFVSWLHITCYLCAPYMSCNLFGWKLQQGG